MIIYKFNNNISLEELINLYKSVDWTAYTDLGKDLIKILENSNYISCYINNKLIGLIRVITDNVSILYIQDILIMKEYQNKGIGTKLLKKILKKYSNIRQVVLLTDNIEKNENFYIKNGFVSVDKLNTIAFIEDK